MSEENFPNQESPEQYEELSKTDAMAGVFSSPGETFETIANSPKKNYWIIPVLISVVVGLISTFLFFQDAELVNKTMDKQKEKMRERFEQNVKEGKMTKEDVDKAMESMDPKGNFAKIIGFSFAAAGPFIILFILSLIYFIILKVMKAEIDYSQILNVVGLSMLIATVGGLLGIVISILKGDMSSVGLGLLLSEATVGEKVYTLLNKLDVFSIWFYIVVAIGLSKVARIDMIRSASIVFGIFIVYAVVTSFIF
ncbi:MAG: YIP1 family protein [Bacteroidota bacterium]|nr:YIP1 family protein [Bacteroidota bacterium]